MLKRLKYMLIKEFLQLFRDPRMRMMVLGVPVLQMLVIAFALTTDVTNIKTAVLDFDNTPSSRELLSEFTSSGYFEVVEYADSQDDIAYILDRSKARVVIHFPPGFESDLRAGRTAKLQILADGTDSNTTSIVFGYVGRIIGDYTREKLLQRLSASPIADRAPVQVEFETRAWFNPNLESKYYYVPSLIAVMLMLICMILPSVAIVREKEMGTIEQVMVTPISRFEFILGKTVPYAIIGYIEMTIMFILAMVVFGIRIEGNWLLLYALSGIYMVGNLGVALLVSGSASTQQQALLTSFLFMMPCILLSGFLFPIRNMPIEVQYATFLNPIRWYLEILRGVVIKGVGAGSLLPAITGQLALAILFILLAMAGFRKTTA
jgi:ABC-2 type transport system permease protein